MTLRLANVTFDCADALEQARFWSEALGLPIKGDANGFFAALDGGPSGPTLLFLQVPEGKTARNGMHIDLGSDDMAGEVQRLVGLRAQVAEKDEYGMTWTVLNDPEGNEFCLSGPHHPDSLRHSFITAALDAGVALREVQDAASHDDPRATMRYDRARHSLDRHATYVVIFCVSGTSRLGDRQPQDSLISPPIGQRWASGRIIAAWRIAAQARLPWSGLERAKGIEPSSSAWKE